MKTFLRLFFIFFVSAALLAAATFFYATTQLQPVNPQQTQKTNFVVPTGQSVSVIGSRLQQAGLIRNALLFREQVWQLHLGSKIQAGTFMLSPSMSTNEVAQNLTRGTNDLWATIPEGWREEEIADMLASQQLPNFDKQEFLNVAKNDEGFLFPDTYLFQRTATADSIYHVLRDTFDKKVTNNLAGDIQASGYSLHDVITLASIVQREARQPQTMKIVAGILEHRLQLGGGLNVDATLQYIHGYDPVFQTWWAEPTSDLKLSTSPFNTYKYKGLPPHPIDNPGLNAINAVLHPTRTDYLYYVTDRQGTMHYAKTLEEHNSNVQQYLR